MFRNTDIINGYFSSIGKAQIASAMLLALKNKEYVKEVIASSLVGADDVITLASENYPIELANIPTPPIVLYARGNVALLQRQACYSRIEKNLSVICEKGRRNRRKAFF